MKLTYNGKLKLAGLEESNVEFATSSTRIKYNIYGDSELQAIGSYAFYYLNHDQVNPLNSHAEYCGFLVMQLKIFGAEERITLKDTGEFKAGIASSKLEVISDIFKGSGQYQARHDGGEFELEIEKI